MGKSKKRATVKTLDASNFFTGDETANALPSAPTGREYTHSFRGGRGGGHGGGGGRSDAFDMGDWRRGGGGAPRSFGADSARSYGGDSARSFGGARGGGSAYGSARTGGARENPYGSALGGGSSAWKPSALSGGKVKQKVEEFPVFKVEVEEVAKVDEAPEETINRLEEAMDEGKPISVSALKKYVRGVDLTEGSNMESFIKCLALSITESTIELGDLRPALHTILDFVPLLESVLITLIKSTSEEQFTLLVRDSKVDLVELLELTAEGAELEAILSSKGLNAIMVEQEVEEVVEEVADVCVDEFDTMVASTPTMEACISALQNVTLTARGSKTVSSYITQLVLRDDSLDSAIPVYRMLAGEEGQFSLPMLNGVQLGWDVSGRPGKKAGRKIFEAIDEQNVVEPEDLLEWRDSADNKDDAKKKLIVQVNTFLFELEAVLRKADEDSEEEEEEAEDEY